MKLGLYERIGEHVRLSLGSARVLSPNPNPCCNTDLEKERCHMKLLPRREFSVDLSIQEKDWSYENISLEIVTNGIIEVV